MFLRYLPCGDKKFTYNCFIERRISMSIKVKFACLGLTCLLSLTSGCVETPMLYHGNAVSSVPVVAMQEGSSIAERWETFDLIIDYKYIKKGDRFEISGQAALSQHYQMAYDGITRMDVYIFFLDKDSRVLETAFLVNTWLGNIRDSQDVSKSYKVPIGTTGISFGYSGEVSTDMGNKAFYALPFK